jgi:hypothetical protein
MSPGERLVMSDSEQVAILGVRADAKSVRWRHMHCVGLSATTQPPPTNACLMASQLQLAALSGSQSSHDAPK